MADPRPRGAARAIRPWSRSLLLLLCACAPSAPPTANCDRSAETATQPHLENGIAVTVERLIPGCGVARVSSGIPLPPGRLTAGQLSQLRVYVGGEEQRLHVEALKGTHPDGSLRSVLVEFDYSLNHGTPVPGEMVLGESRGTTDIARSGDGDGPQAVVLPTDPDYLVSTNIVGPTITVASATAQSSTIRKYEEDFRSFADVHWQEEGAKWEGNYYDRALIYYAWWTRTGNPTYWKRATAIALNYRKDYLEPNNYNSSAHWLQIEGLETHYLLTGDAASHVAIGRLADVFNVDYYMENLGDLTAPMDNRMQARTLMALLTAWRLGAESRDGANWATLLPQALGDILASQDAGGAYRFQQVQCGYNKPWMVGLLNDALIKYYTYFNADARIPASIQKANDYMWTNDWNAAEQAFVYLDGPCPGDEGGPAPDLNNLTVTSFAWTFARTGNTAYRDRADQIFAGAVAKAWLNGSKQFNQQYTSSYRYLAYRQ